jgi:trans-aconitate methyltransferase
MTPPDGDDQNEWSTSRYEGSHSFVYEYGEDVIELLAPQAGERILDLGCGTGHLTDRIAESGAEVIGLDRSEEMIEEARSTYPDYRFVHADARNFSFEKPFDAIFSNAALHWIREQDALLESVSTALRPGGRFVAEFGGTGNVSAIVEAIRAELATRGHSVETPWYFPSIGEHASTLEEHGFEVRYATLFDRPTELESGADGLAGWLDMFADSFLSPLSDAEREDVVSSVEERLRPSLFEDGVWVADYRRIRVVAISPGSSRSE